MYNGLVEIYNPLQIKRAILFPKWRIFLFVTERMIQVA